MKRATLALLITISQFSILNSQLPPSLAAQPDAKDYFRIQVIDAQTKRGIPLVELETTNCIRYQTDSNGLVAFYEPGLMDQKVFFSVSSHGYEFAKDGFGIAGRQLDVKPGGRATLEMKRINIAERLYRLTGGGIYRDTVLLGEKPPTAEPLLNGRVFGQDSILNVIYKDTLYWFWGDTGWPAYPLGNFDMTGATSRLPDQGGLDPDVGVNLQYLLREDGFTRKMTPMEGDGPTWAWGYCTIKENGQERMVAGYSKIKGASMQTYRRGLCMFDDAKGYMDHVADWPLSHPIKPGGHALPARLGGQDYIFYEIPFPLIRVRATLENMKDITRFEAFTCLKEGTTVKDAQIDRGPDGTARYTWKRNTPVLSAKEERELVEAGKLKADEVLLHLQDADSGKPISPHAGSIYWNNYRKRWVLIDSELMGTSMLGEIWYAEADSPLGPWVYARKVVTHDKYSFYNPKQHPYFAKDNGRVIYFEGTYTELFSGAPVKTPRYDYNQIMYRMDLADPRPAVPTPVYELTGPGGGGAFATGPRVPQGLERGAIVFFAPDRAAPGLLPVYEVPAGAATRLQLGGEAPTGVAPRFFALAPDTKNPPTTTIPLLETTTADGHHRYGTAGEGKPVCLVWRTPLSAEASKDGRFTWKE